MMYTAFLLCKIKDSVSVSDYQILYQKLDYKSFVYVVMSLIHQLHCHASC